MFRVYLEDKSFYDVAFNGSLGEFLQYGLLTSTNLSILETTSGEIAINRELIVKIIKL
jgi:hypothetical protein